jgi:hypothetical protein
MVNMLSGVSSNFPDYNNQIQDFLPGLSRKLVQDEENLLRIRAEADEVSDGINLTGETSEELAKAQKKEHQHNERSQEVQQKLAETARKYQETQEEVKKRLQELDDDFYKHLPPGLAKKKKVPPGHAKDKGLPPGLAKKQGENDDKKINPREELEARRLEEARRAEEAKRAQAADAAKKAEQQKQQQRTIQEKAEAKIEERKSQVENIRDNIRQEVMTINLKSTTTDVKSQVRRLRVNLENLEAEQTGEEAVRFLRGSIDPESEVEAKSDLFQSLMDFTESAINKVTNAMGGLGGNIKAGIEDLGASIKSGVDGITDSVHKMTEEINQKVRSHPGKGVGLGLAKFDDDDGGWVPPGLRKKDKDDYEIRDRYSQATNSNSTDLDDLAGGNGNVKLTDIDISKIKNENELNSDKNWDMIIRADFNNLLHAIQKSKGINAEDDSQDAVAEASKSPMGSLKELSEYEALMMHVNNAKSTNVRLATDTMRLISMATSMVEDDNKKNRKNELFHLSTPEQAVTDFGQAK